MNEENGGGVMKLVDNVKILSVNTTLDIPSERVLEAALKSALQNVVVIGFNADKELYFASSMGDCGDTLWWMEIAKKQLLETEF